jgi:hypothetical protein
VASLSGANLIVLKGDFGQFEEGPLAAPALPGQNVLMTTANEVFGRHTYTPGATLAGGTAAGGASSPITVVMEDSLQGKTVNDSYAAGDNVRLYKPKKGDIIQVLALTGEDIDKGEGVSANAGGKWVAATVNRVAVSLEDTGGPLAADMLIRVRVD